MNINLLSKFIRQHSPHNTHDNLTFPFFSEQIIRIVVSKCHVFLCGYKLWPLFWERCNILSLPFQERRQNIYFSGLPCNLCANICSECCLKRGLPWWLRVKNPLTNAGDMGLIDSWAGKIPWRKKWQTTPGVLPGEFHGQKTLVGYSSWGLKRVRQDLTTKEQQQNCLKKHLLENINILN